MVVCPYAERKEKGVARPAALAWLKIVKSKLDEAYLGILGGLALRALASGIPAAFIWRAEGRENVAPCSPRTRTNR